MTSSDKIASNDHHSQIKSRRKHSAVTLVKQITRSRKKVSSVGLTDDNYNSHVLAFDFAYQLQVRRGQVRRGRTRGHIIPMVIKKKKKTMNKLEKNVIVHHQDLSLPSSWSLSPSPHRFLWEFLER